MIETESFGEILQNAYKILQIFWLHRTAAVWSWCKKYVVTGISYNTCCSKTAIID